MATPFVHLHNHSEFSFLDGASKIKEMAKIAVEMDMPAIALTDHGTMYGSFEFYEACKSVGVQPIVGCELYVATRGRRDRDPKRDGNHHLVALAKNETGYRNLMKLATKASLEGMYYKPRVDKELLAEHSEGLVICSACMGGELAQSVIQKKGHEETKRVAAWYREVFGDDFYLEIQGHGAQGQQEVNEEVVRVARALNIPLVATNDAHYLRAADASAHDILLCIQTSTTISDPKRMRYEPREFYLKTHEEMFGAFEHLAPDAVENTLGVAEKCKLDIEVGRAPMPPIPLPDGHSDHSYLTVLCWEGLERRIKNVSDTHRDRLKYELEIIEKTGFSRYFLIVRDIAQYARGSKIYFGVRGSAAGSLASFCIGITDLDPIEYNLTFERFLNPERVTMPDIDMDFEDTRRSDVIKHVAEKYGEENVGFISTFGTLGAKAAIRDVCRAMGLPLSETDRIAKMIPKMPLGLSIQQSMDGYPAKDYPGNPEMKREYETNPMVREVIDTAKSIEGLTRNSSIHAAGIMISDVPLVEYTPLVRTNDGSVATQYPHSSLEKIGLLKMDFLGLINLTILARAVDLIQETKGDVIDVWDIPLDASDPRALKAYDMLSRGETTGIFQLESDGMRRWIVDLKPRSVKELAAMVALYRPGPMDHIPRYIRSKFDPSQIQYTHPTLEPILGETYGVIVYQDQVLKIVQAVAGFTLGQADLLRRAMGKKKKSEMDQQRANFMKGSAERGIPEKVADQIFSEIEPFAGYAFNGAHAACYAMVAYQTAYLKANYPAEYLAAYLGAYADRTEKIVGAIDECGRLGVNVLPPDINTSRSEFSVPEDGKILFGLLGIKNVGKAPVDAILAARTNGGAFRDLGDFCDRVFAEGLTSKSVIEMLIKAGALSCLHPNRKALLEGLDDCVAAAQRNLRDQQSGLMSLFDGDDSQDASLAAQKPLPTVPDFSRGERLAFEKELLGLYLTEHPVKPFEPELRRKHRAVRIEGLTDVATGANVVIGGMVTDIRQRNTTSGQLMLTLQLEDTSGSVSVTCFPKVTAEYGRLVLVNSILAISGRVQRRERISSSTNAEDEANETPAQAEIICDRIERVVENAMASDARPRIVHLKVDNSCKSRLRMVRDVLASAEGGSQLLVHVQPTDDQPVVVVSTRFLVDPDEQKLEQVRRMLGGGYKRCWIE